MSEAVLGLGANLGDAAAQLGRAIDGLARTPGIHVVAVAGLWRSAPVGGPDQPDFHNTIAVVHAEGTPEDLLDRAHRLEELSGRTRDVRWGPRTLDVDVIAFDAVTSGDPHLTLPHPRAHERAFVLRPWAQLQPARALTADGQTRTIAQWADLRTDQELEQVGEGRWWS